MNCHSIENEIVLFKQDSSVVLEFVVPEESDFFSGHFPNFKLLPAVGQFELVSRFVKKYFSTSRSVLSIKRMKFLSPILPNEKIKMKLDYKSDDYSVNFKLMSSLNEEIVFSSGVFTVEKDNE